MVVGVHHGGEDMKTRQGMLGGQKLADHFSPHTESEERIASGIAHSDTLAKSFRFSNQLHQLWDVGHVCMWDKRSYLPL